MRRNVSLLYASAFLITAGHAFARGMLVTPVQAGLTGAAGTTVTTTVTVSSARPEDTQIRATVTDFRRAIDGTIQEIPAAEAARSCRAWIEIDQREFVSPKSGTIPLVVTAHIPKEASGSYWALLQLDAVPASESIMRQKSGTQLGFQVVPRVAVPIVVTVSGTGTVSIVSRDLVAKRRDDGKLDITQTVENTGTVAVMLSGAFAVEHKGTTANDAEELASVDVGPATSLPGAKLRITGLVDWKGDAASTVAHAYLRYGSGPNDTVEAIVPLKP
jgi:hypothetical protein